MEEMKTNAMTYTSMGSPIGPLLLAGDERGLSLVYFVNGRRPKSPPRTWVEDKKPFKEVVRQLQAYFEGKLKDFDLPLVLEGTEFQLLVWRNVRKIPYGETVSYGHWLGALAVPMPPALWDWRTAPIPYRS
jgi:methylated-DNA-[protein]-cysteine S-methyltransferase